MPYLFENHRLDPDRRELFARGEPVSLEPQVFDLLVYLIRNRSRVVSKDDLIAAVWDGRIVSDSTLDSRINAARKALGDNGQRQQFIRTVIRKCLAVMPSHAEFVARTCQAPPLAPVPTS